MAIKTLIATIMISTLPAASNVAAQSVRSSAPAALVEDVKSATAGVEFMDYVVSGRVIRLKSQDRLVLSYLKSCMHEAITGGTVAVGAERSDVQDGQVVRTTVPCEGGRLRLSAQQANESAATSFRSLDSKAELPRLYGQAPLVQLPKALAGKNRVLLIGRKDQPGERHKFKIDRATAASGVYDLAKRKVNLVPGATYDASIGRDKLTFQIDQSAKSGEVPIVSRLVSFR